MREILKRATDRAKSVYLFWVAINLSIFFYQGGFFIEKEFYKTIEFKYISEWFPFYLEVYRYHESIGTYDITELLFYCLVPPLIYFSKKMWPKKKENEPIAERKEKDETEEQDY
ncbi:MAG: hypothetical protein N2043_00955 [Ignavibacterium sp.]|nr:hypothetical protein [Ignavibacterium sp.]